MRVGARGPAGKLCPVNSETIFRERGPSVDFDTKVSKKFNKKKFVRHLFPLKKSPLNISAQVAGDDDDCGDGGERPRRRTDGLETETTTKWNNNKKKSRTGFTGRSLSAEERRGLVQSRLLDLLLLPAADGKDRSSRGLCHQPVAGSWVA